MSLGANAGAIKHTVPSHTEACKGFLSKHFMEVHSVKKIKDADEVQKVKNLLGPLFL